MIDLAQLDDLARRLSNLVPPGLREGREELQQNFKSVLQAGLGKLDLVTREEFDVQRAVLARTRDKLEALERQLAELVAAAGLVHPSELRSHHIVRRVTPHEILPLSSLHPPLQPGELLDGEADAPVFRTFWARARPDSFQPA